MPPERQEDDDSEPQGSVPHQVSESLREELRQEIDAKLEIAMQEILTL